MTMKLHARNAVLKETKSAAQKRLTALHRLSGSTAAAKYNGFQKVYAPLAEGGETLPPEPKLVEVRAETVLADVRAVLSDLIDQVHEQDEGNTRARADIVIDGVVLAPGVPVTTLIGLEKQLVDLRTLVSEMPTLDDGKEWTWSANAGLWHSDPTRTLSKRRVKVPLVLYPATQEHPAQTQIIEQEETAGTWTMTHLSGALPNPQKRAILARIETLLREVRAARTRANEVEVQPSTLGRTLMNYVLGS